VRRRRWSGRRPTPCIRRAEAAAWGGRQDPDISIRRRALDLVYLLVNPGNVRPLVAELLNFLSTADVARSRTRPTPESGGGAPGRRAPGDRRGTGQEFKEDLTSKICALVAKQAPSRKFQTDTTIKVCPRPRRPAALPRFATP
jgi:AP-1 complex subunit gamma-1